VKSLSVRMSRHLSAPDVARAEMPSLRSKQLL
jgi:hypothetical protein